MLQQTRAGLQTALREITTCRAAKQQALRDLTACEASSAHTGKELLVKGKELQQEHALHSEDEKCLAELQKTKEAYRQRVTEEQQLRLRLEAEKGAAEQSTRQLALLQAQYSAQAIDARVDAKVDAACQQRVASAQLEWRKRTDDAVRATRQLKAKLETQEQLEAQLGTLRHRLEQKQQLEAAIEGKHSKLTEVYKALESACQNELDACREAAGQPPAPPMPAAAADAAAADVDAGSEGGKGGRLLSDGAEPDGSDGCSAPAPK